MLAVSGTVVSSYLTQWFKRGATSVLNHVVKAFQCCHHTSCPDPCCPHLQTCASPVFPSSMNEVCHSTDLPQAIQLVTKSSGNPDISQIHLLPFSLAPRNLYQPVFICHHSTLPGSGGGSIYVCWMYDFPELEPFQMASRSLPGCKTELPRIACPGDFSERQC